MEERKSEEEGGTRVARKVRPFGGAANKVVSVFFPEVTAIFGRELTKKCQSLLGETSIVGAIIASWLVKRLE